MGTRLDESERRKKRQTRDGSYSVSIVTECFRSDNHESVCLMIIVVICLHCFNHVFLHNRLVLFTVLDCGGNAAF